MTQPVGATGNAKRTNNESVEHTIIDTPALLPALAHVTSLALGVFAIRVLLANVHWRNMKKRQDHSRGSAAALSFHNGLDHLDAFEVKDLSLKI